MDYYTKKYKEYTEKTENIDMTYEQDMFLHYLFSIWLRKKENKPELINVLDVGCGSGRDSKRFKELDLSVHLMDESLKMLALATKRVKPDGVFSLDVRDMDFVEKYQGVWACASLLHIPIDDMEYAFEKIWRALKFDGIFYFSFKEGKGEIIDKDNRLFTFLSMTEIDNILNKFNFKVLNSWVNNEFVENGPCINWLNYIVKKEVV